MNRTYYLLGEPSGKPIRIYNSDRIVEMIPPGFQAVTIALNGALHSDLDWKKQVEKAREYCKQGLKIFWEMDLGLFSKLPEPLSEQMQFLALQLSLKHFRESISKEFQEHTVGISLYRGSMDFVSQMKWNADQLHNLQEWIKELYKEVQSIAEDLEEPIENFHEINPELLQKSAFGKKLLQLFCRNAFFEYADLLARSLPLEINTFLLFRTGENDDAYLVANLIAKERFDSLHFGITSSQLPVYTFTNHIQAILESRITHDIPVKKPSTAICLPLQHYFNKENYLLFTEIVSDLQKQDVAFRIISENDLTTSWEGIDRLFVIPSAVSPQGKRKLHGFTAAGGIVVETKDNFLTRKAGLPSAAG